MSDIGEVFQQMSDAAAKDAPITSREELLKNHTMPDLPCPVCSTLCRADVVLRHKQAISDNAQRPVTPVTDAMVEAGARVMAARRGIKNSDELITTTNSGKVPAWQFYIEEPRAILEAALSSLPSTGLPAPAPHAEVRLSEQECHAIGHARYQVENSTPDNPDCCFDYQLVETLLDVIDRFAAQPYRAGK